MKFVGLPLATVDLTLASDRNSGGKRQHPAH